MIRGDRVASGPRVLSCVPERLCNTIEMLLQHFFSFFLSLSEQHTEDERNQVG